MSEVPTQQAVSLCECACANRNGIAIQVAERRPNPELTDSGKNAKKVFCSRCDSVILLSGVGEFSADRSFDVPLMYQKRSEAPVIETEKLSSWWLVRDMFHFENIGFTNPHEGMKFLACADCEIGPVGLVDPNDPKLFLLSTERVEYR